MKAIVKIGIFLLLAAAVFYAIVRLATAYNLPPRMASYCEEADYILNIRDDSLEGKAVFLIRGFRQDEFRLLSSQVALTSVKVDGKDRPVFEKNGFFFVFIERKKESMVDLNFTKKFQGVEEKYSLELAVPRAARNKIELAGIRGQQVVFNGQRFNEFETQDSPDKVWLDLPPASVFTLTWQRSKSGAKPARVFTQRYTSVEIRDKSLYYRTVCDYQIKDGQVSSFVWMLAGQAEEIEIESPGIHSVEVKEQSGQKQVEVQLTAPIRGEYRIELTYAQGYKNEMADVFTARPAESINEDEYIIIVSREELQIVPVIEKGLNEFSLDEIPAQLSGLTEAPMFKSYHQVNNKARLQMTFIRFGRAEGIETAVDKAEYEVYFSPLGQEIVRASFEVRNMHNQFMQLELPQGAVLCSVRSLDKPIAPLQLENGIILVPLEKSIESFSGYVTFPVNISYLLVRNRGTEKQVSAVLPALGVPVSYLKWRLIMPAESNVKWKQMDVYSVDQFSDEKAVRMLEYARGAALTRGPAELAGPAGTLRSEEEYGLADAREVLKDFNGLIKAKTDLQLETTSAPEEPMPAPQVISTPASPGITGEKFKEIDFGKLYDKVVSYSKNIANEEKIKTKGGVRSVKVSGDVRVKGIYRENYDLKKETKEQAEKAVYHRETVDKDNIKEKLSKQYSLEAQKAYRAGSLEKAQEGLSRALETNIAQQQALQLAENVNRLQQIEEVKEAKDSTRAQRESEGKTIPASWDLTAKPLNGSEPKKEIGDVKKEAEQSQKESRIYSQAQTFKRSRNSVVLDMPAVEMAPGQAPLLGQPVAVPLPEGTNVSVLGEDISAVSGLTGQKKLAKPGRPLLLRYNLVLVPDDLSKGIGGVIDNRAQPVLQRANKDYDNWTNTADFYSLNNRNFSGYNRMNLDAVQENTLVDMLNESYGAGNILASRVVRADENNIVNISWASLTGTRYARIRPVIVDEEYIDLYLTLPRRDNKGETKEEETAVRIKRGQTAVVGGIPGTITALGQKDSGLVLMINADILEKMASGEIENFYTRRYMDISMPAGEVYKFEKLLVKANEILTINMEVTE